MVLQPAQIKKPYRSGAFYMSKRLVADLYRAAVGNHRAGGTFACVLEQGVDDFGVHQAMLYLLQSHAIARKLGIALRIRVLLFGGIGEVGNGCCHGCGNAQCQYHAG